MAVIDNNNSIREVINYQDMVMGGLDGIDGYILGILPSIDQVQ